MNDIHPKILEYWQPKRRNRSLLQLHLLLLILLATLTHCTFDNNDLLTPDERSWVTNHSHELRWTPSESYHPIDFIDSAGIAQGITADILSLIEKKTNITIIQKPVGDWSSMVHNIKHDSLDIIGSIQSTQKRRKYLNFTTPYISLQNVIITRTSNTHITTLAHLSNKRVGIVKEYATIPFVKKSNPEITIIPVKDNATGLQLVSFGHLDAFIADLAVSSYYIHKLSISNLRYSNSIGYNWNLCIGSRSELPVLHTILQKGINAISEHERQSIINKWITPQPAPFYMLQEFWFIVALILLIPIICIILILSWNRMLQKKIEQHSKTLVQSEQKKHIHLENYHALVSSLPGVSYRCAFDTHWTMEFMSDQIEELSGYPSSDFINNSIRSFSSIIAKADVERVSTAVTSAIDHKEAFTIQYNIICKSGAIKSVYERGQGMYNSNGELNCLTGVIIDTSNINETKASLQSANNFIEHIIDSMDSICIAVNNSLQVTHWNSATSQLTGIPKKDALHSHLYDVYPTLKADDAIIQEVLATSTPQMFLDHVHQSSDLNKEYVNVSISPINSGSQHGLVIQLNVVTDKHYPLQRHHQKIKLDALGSLATTIAHDFNNALAGIIGGAQLLLSPKVSIGDKAESYAQLILRTAYNAKEFTDSIYALGNTELLVKKPFDFLTVISEVLQLIEHHSESPISVQFENYASFTTVNGNAHSLTLTLYKLITSIQNSIAEDAILSMSTRSVHLSNHQCAISQYSIKSGDFISVDIVDSSNSIPFDQLKLHVDPFNTEELQSNDMDLNRLLIYKALIDHSGALEITKTEYGTTTISLLFPLSDTPIPDAPPSDIQKSDSASNTLKTGTILLVDDEESLILSGVDLLEDLGYTVLSALDGIAAIETYTKNMDTIDIVITDLLMPRKNGKEVLTEIVTLNPRCKVIVVSGATRPKEVTELKKLGAYDVLQKPYEPKMLISILEKAFT